MPPTSPIGWLRSEEFRVKGALALALAALWIVVYGGANLVTGLHDWRLPLAMDWEAQVPFVPWMAPVYLSLNVLVLLPLFVIRTWKEIVPLFVVMVAQTLIAGVCFVLLPAGQPVPPPPVAGLLGGIFRVADALNLEHNYVPSLHVTYALTASFAIGLRCRWPGRTSLALWAGAIAASTVLLRQHHVIDIVAAFVLAGGTLVWLYERAGTPAFLRTVRAEVLCLREIYLYSRRHLRYLVVALFVYRFSLFRWRRLRAIRVGFCFLQTIDDILDGDRPTRREPIEIVDEILMQIERGAFDDSVLGCLAECLLVELDRLRNERDRPREELVVLIRHMRDDRLRVRDARLLTAGELREHHRKTFHHAVNLMLTLGGAEVRAADAPDLIEAFGWCSVMRDLREDIGKGLVNIPSSVIEEARSEGLGHMDHDALVGTGPVRLWLDEEYGRALALLDRSEGELARLEGRHGAGLLRLFHRSIRRFAVKAARRYGWEQPGPGEHRSRPRGSLGSPH